MVSTADITQTAKQGLSEFSFDFRGLNVTSVTIDGVAATYTRDEATDKLIITPAAGIANGRTFHTVIAYNGVPVQVQDPDDSFEGWLRTADGAFLVNEPMGAMSWFPANNHPLDKARYDFHLTVPSTHTALGNGELVSKVDHANNTSTWNWHMGYPMATYLSTSTVGVFDYCGPRADAPAGVTCPAKVGATALGASGNPLELYNAWESTFTAAQKATMTTAFNREDQITKFLADYTGVAYPFDSIGAVADRLPSALGYVLEVQTKIHFPSSNISHNTLAHEIAHQWFGNSVSLEQWEDIWLNEGWATWSQWNWSNRFNNGSTPAALFTSNYNSTSQPARWNTPSADMPSAAELFDTFPVYTRGAMTLEGLRQIIGETSFQALQTAWLTENRYGNVDTADFIALTKRIAREKSGFEASNLAKLDEYFQQWLYRPGKPAMTPAVFFASTTVPGVPISGTVPATLSLSVGSIPSFGAFTPGTAATYTAGATGNVISTAGDATLSVVDPSTNAPGRLVNGTFALQQPLQVKATDAATPASPFAALSGTPLTLLTWNGPVSNDAVTFDFQQSIGANEPLRTGAYSKTLTFTLSTTSP
jgi:aminopeptidase N